VRLNFLNGVEPQLHGSEVRGKQVRLGLGKQGSAVSEIFDV